MCVFQEAIQKHYDGVLLDLFVTPGAAQSVFPAGYNPWRKRIEMKVCSEAKGNKANKEVVTIVADFFKKPVNKIQILRGAKSREKTLLVRDITYDEAVKRLMRTLNGL